MTAAIYGGMPLQIIEAKKGKRGRAFDDSTVRLMEAIVDEVGRHETAITARHLFYRLTGATEYRPAVITKTDEAYDKLTDTLLKLRRSGDVPWEMVVDGTRIKTRWVGFGSLGEAADEWARSYRRDIWRTNWATCEVWTESRGLLTTINVPASEYGTPTLGVGGFPSATVGWETAQDVKRSARRGQAFHVFYFGDWDPSGKAIGHTAERDVRTHLSDAENELFTFERVALTPGQIQRYALPSAPVKLNKDGTVKGNHAKRWDRVTELDALDPKVLNAMVTTSIESIIDPQALSACRAAEASERQVITNIVATMGGAA